MSPVAIKTKYYGRLKPYSEKVEFVAHVRRGLPIRPNYQGWKCLVCRTSTYCPWTDYNGQCYCGKCGTTYQVNAKGHVENGIFKINSDITIPGSEAPAVYCDVYPILPLLRFHWCETEQPAPIGAWVSRRNPYKNENYILYYLWLKANSNRLYQLYKDLVNWDGIQEALIEMGADGMTYEEWMKDYEEDEL